MPSWGMPDSLGRDAPNTPVASLAAGPNRKRARLRPPKADNPVAGQGLPTEADSPITTVMLSAPPSGSTVAPTKEGARAPAGSPAGECELPGGTPVPTNRVAQRVTTSESVVSSEVDDLKFGPAPVVVDSVGNLVAVVDGPPRTEVGVRGRTKESALFYEEMKALGFESLTDVGAYLELSRAPWPEWDGEKDIPKNHPRLRHAFQSGPWDPTWRWCWEQVTRFGYSVAPKRTESEVRFLLEVDL